MNILHVLTTGTSLLENIKKEREDDYRHVARALIPSAAGPGTVHEMLSEACRAGDSELDLNTLLSVVAQGALAAASPLDGAEWTSVDAVRLDPLFPTTDLESFLFIASDTDDGLRAAALLATGHEPEAVHYVPEPLEHGDRRVAGNEAWICRVPRLDLGSTSPDSRTWRSLGAVGRLVCRSAQPGAEWTVVLHYSGGYKAIVPYVMVLATAIRSRLSPAGASVRAVALHESSKRRAERIVIETPVQGMDSDLWDGVKALRHALRPGSDVVPVGVAELLGALMTERIDDHRRRLTPPGLISTHVL